MTARYLLSKEVLHLTIRVPKEDAGFVLHLLEGSDNLCFPTTLTVEPHSQWRDLLLRAPIEWETELRRWLLELQSSIPILVLEDRVIKDD